MVRHKAIIVVVFAASILLCAILYNVINGTLTSSNRSQRPAPWPYTTAPYTVPTIPNSPGTITLSFPNLNLGSRSLPGLTTTTLPRTPVTGKPKPPTPAPPTTTTTQPLIPITGINQTLCKSLPALCGITHLLDGAVDGAAHIITGK